MADEAEKLDLEKMATPDEVKPKEAVEAKPAEAKKPEEVKPAVEEQKPDGTAWKLLRQKERELADLRKQMAERDKPAAEVKPKQTQDEFLENIRNQERDFQTKQADYPEALKYIETAEVNEWQKTGMAAADIRDLKLSVARCRSGDTRFKVYADHLERIASRADVMQLAEKQNQDPEDVAAFLVTRDTYLTSRRQLV